MPSRLVKQPNGLYARFSTVVDDFTDYGMTREEVAKMFLDDYRKQAEDHTTEALLYADSHADDWEDALYTIQEMHGKRTANRRIKRILGK